MHSHHLGLRARRFRGSHLPPTSPLELELNNSDVETLSNDALVTLIAEQSAEMRYRSQAEHFFTAAAIGSFGAVIWGIAAVTAGALMTAPIAGVGALAVSGGVHRKIVQEHQRYRKAKAARALLVEVLMTRLGDGFPIPPDLKNGIAGDGYRQSLFVLWLAAIATAAFCLTVVIRALVFPQP